MPIANFVFGEEAGNDSLGMKYLCGDDCEAQVKFRKGKQDMACKNKNFHDNIFATTIWRVFSFHRI